MLEEKEWVHVQEAHLNCRLDKALSLFFPEYSRTYFQKLIDMGSVKINGSFLKKREKLKLGDEIEVTFTQEEALSLEPENIPLEILFEDDYFIAINKPRGLVVHPAPGHPKGTVVNALLHHHKVEKEEGSIRPGIVHRLDKDTSGVLLVAKHLSAHAKLSALFSERKISKTYVAICLSNPGNVIINAPLARHPIKRKEIAVSDKESAKEAITVCRTIASNQELSFIELDLITGRTHQIRVHLKYKNAPVLGDEIYGAASANAKYKVHHQMLHAYKISFEHPFTKQKIVIEAPIPKDIQHFFNQLAVESKNYLLD